MNVVEKVDRILTSGSRITFTMQGEAKPDEAALKASCEKNRVKFVSLTKETRKAIEVAYSIECPGFT